MSAPSSTPSPRQVKWLRCWRGPWFLRLRASRAAWVGAAVMVTAAIVLREISALLEAIEGGNGRAYSASVFTQLRLTPWSGGKEIDAAWKLWTSEPLNQASGWIDGHLIIDAVFFTPAYCLLLFLLMGSVGVEQLPAARLARFVLIADELENVYTWLAFKFWPTSAVFSVIPFLSLLKWAAVIGAVVTIVVCWARPDVEGPISAGATQRRLTDTVRAGAEPGPAVLLRGLMVVVGLFLALVALPLGGPLEQLPDVVRYQIEEAWLNRNWVPLALSSVALMLFTAMIVIAGLWISPPAVKGPVLRDRWVLIGAGSVGGAIIALNLIFKGPNWAVGLAPLLVVLALMAVDGLRGRAFTPEPQPIWRVVWGAITRWRRKAPVPSRGESASEPQVADSPNSGGSTTEETISVPATAEEATGPASAAADISATRMRWAGGLAGLVVIGGGLGLVRAGVRPLLLGSWPWLAGILVGVLLACGGGLVTQWAVTRFADAYLRSVRDKAARTPVRILMWLALAVVGGAALIIAAHPAMAAYVGTSGTLALGFAILALLIGVGHHTAARRVTWAVTTRLKLGTGMPWVGLVMVTWLVASLLNTAGGYHNARLVNQAPAPRYATLQTAWQQWLTAASANPECRLPNQHLPMVLVAAPGGGIRATYWATSVLDALAPSADLCGRTRIFAVSAVSGSSIGTVEWMQATPGTATDNAGKIAADHALAAAAAALFLRDLPQPFVGLSDEWRWADRAAELEDGWRRDIPGVLDGAWSTVGNRAQTAWTPAVMLNSSSGADGCRILVTNVGGLPADPASCHGQMPHSGDAGLLAGTLDATDRLATHLGNDGDPCDTSHPADLQLASAALLSARFPLVSPSGVLERCQSELVQTSYAIDGGYYENSGLLTVLQLRDALDPLIREHNRTSPDKQVDPWIVLADNHYRSSATTPPLNRQREFTVPLSALGNRTDITGQENLEQAADLATRSTGPGGTSRFLRLAPHNGPTIQAPLGWVLSEASRDNLREELGAAICAIKQDPQLQPQQAVLPPSTLARPCSDATPG